MSIDPSSMKLLRSPAGPRRLATSHALIGSLLAAILHVALWLPCSAEPLAIRKALELPTFRSLELAPDGRTISAIAYVKGGRAVMLIDTTTLAARIVRGAAWSFWTMPYSVHWVGKDLLAIDTFQGVEIMDTTGQELRTVGSGYVRALRPGADGHERILARHSGQGAYIDRIDVRTGKGDTTNFDMPGTPLRWTFDAEGNARVVTTMDSAFWTDDTRMTHWYRRSIDDPWTKLAEFDVADGDKWFPAYFTRDGKSLVVWSRIGRDTLALFRYDLDAKRIGEMMAGHPTQDISVGRDENDEYDVVITHGMKREIIWFDRRMESLQRGVDAALPGRLNILSREAGGKVLVTSTADVDPGRWYVLDTGRMTLKEVVAAMPGIDPGSMRPMQVVRYRARDGLEIPAYLTLPEGNGKALPAVVLIHGGPRVRDHWEWNPEVQMLASRGYAVFQPQFRGSAGFGKAFELAGIRQWGRAMQDDVTDGVQWLITTGIADPARVCIYGASYGGYAALWGVAKTPDLFRCGISFAGVSDLAYMLKDDSDINERAAGRVLARSMVGDPKAATAELDAVSPVLAAASIKAPLLLVHGTRDARVPIEHGERMVKALKTAGKVYKYLPLQDEAHGIAQEANQALFYDALFDWLDRYIGKGAPSVPGN